MQLATPGVFTRPATIQDAHLVHAAYLQTPQYFKIISIPTPTLAEVERELEAAADDPRRKVELVLMGCHDIGPDTSPNPDPHGAILDELSGRQVIGYLDYKLDYPNPGDATVNLLLVHELLQSRGYGRACVRDLETRLKPHTKRILASIYGKNPRAERFWSRLGYHFAIDAQPILDWYAKELY